MEEKLELTVYTVRNQEGKWFHTIGYGGIGKSWDSDFKKARIFTTLSGARSRVTYFANKWPEYGVPEIVEFSLIGTRVLSETDRVKAILNKKKVAKELSEIRRKKQELLRAEAVLAEAQQRLNKIKAKF